MLTWLGGKPIMAPFTGLSVVFSVLYFAALLLMLKKA